LLRPGLLNGISQVLIKCCAPGVPDVYQGCETFDFSLVDPDNRRPVDFAWRPSVLAALDAWAAADPAGCCDALLDEIGDGRLKLYVTSRVLRHRAQRPHLYASGHYVPVRAAGPRRASVVAFARRYAEQAVLVVAGRHFVSLPSPTGATTWEATSIRVPATLGGPWVDVLSGRVHAPVRAGRSLMLSIGEVFAHLPFALLELRKE
jgi:(1->4)-alpha-D-glucan 1-alpha-D-glucosylmutase